MITKKIFNDLAIFMMGFGIIVGIFFPFMAVILNIPSNYVLNPTFFITSIIAGLLVGFVNVFLSRLVVGKKLVKLADHMQHVEERINNRMQFSNNEDCLDEHCYFKVQSEDEIGMSAQAFNSLVRSLADAIQKDNTIRSFTETLASNLELNKLAEKTLNTLLEEMKADGGAILLEKNGDLSCISSFGINKPNDLLENNTVWQVIKNKRRYYLEFPKEIKIDGLFAEFNPKCVVVEPILYKEFCMGVIILAGNACYEETELDLLKIFNNGLALAFRNAITYQQLENLASNDPLTGIYNRRFGLVRLAEEFSRSQRFNQPIGLLMIDIDHFKQVNDTYGHIIGDRVLIDLALTIKKSLREGDILFRYGGEEFCVVLPGASIQDSYTLSERIRHMAEDLRVKIQEQEITVTISLGGSSYPEATINNDNQLLDKADQNLYSAKENGRNQSCIKI